MVRGMKRKIPMEKIEKKDPRAVAFSKRRKGLYNKASELCHLSDAQIAIIATLVSSNSNVYFYTFGHSSVDSVVDAFLADQRPGQDDESRLGFWWEDESLAKSEDPEELRNAIDAMTTMLQDLKESVKKKESVSHVTHQKQTLNPQPCSAMICIQDDKAMNFKGFHKNTEEQVVAVSDNSNNNGLLGAFDGCSQELDHILDFKTNSEDLSMNLGIDDVSMVKMNYLDCIQDGIAMNFEGFHNNTEEQVIAVSDNSNDNRLLGTFDGCNQDQEFDLDNILDFFTSSDVLSMNLGIDEDQMLAISYDDNNTNNDAFT